MSTGRRANNEGSIYESPKRSGKWHVRFSAGEDPTGKPIRVHRRARNKTEATRVLNQLKREYRDSGAVAKKSRITVAFVIDDWLENVASKTNKESTLETNRGYINKRIAPVLGSILVDRLTVHNLDDAYAGWLADPDRPLSPSTVRKLHAILSSAFSAGVKRGTITKDVTKHVTPPAPAAFYEEPLSVEEVKAILAEARRGPRYVRWLIALMLGLRQGECLGLRWRDVHIDREYITVSESLGRRKWKHGCGPACGLTPARCPARYGGGLVTSTPKSGKSRDVAISASVATALGDMRASQSVAKAIAGSEWIEQGFVFTNEFGQPLDPKMDYIAWKDLCKAAGVRETRLHNARHTAGTIMGSLGTSLREVQETFGHSSSKVTERYVHTQAEGLRRAARRMDDALVDRASESPISGATETIIETSHGLITFGGTPEGESPSQNESRLGDSNSGPTHYECVALPLS